MGSRTSRFLFALALLLSLLPAVRAGAQEATTRTLVFPLAYADEVTSPPVWVSVRWETNPFGKEPDFAGRKVHRGMVQNGEHEADRVRVIWDPAKGLLYVDRNCNNDLTDDEPHEKTQELGLYQFFHRVEMPFPEGGEPRFWKADVNLRAPEGGDKPRAGFIPLPGWHGNIELAGRKYPMTLKDNRDGKIAYGDRIRIGNPSITESGIPSRLCVDGRLYEMSFQFEPADRMILRVVFQETQKPMGECILAGEGIERLVLIECKPPDKTRSPIMIRNAAGEMAPRKTTPEASKNGTVAVFERPPKTITVPAGNYLQRVFLKGEPSPGRLISDRLSETHPVLEITAGQKTVSRVGGPLRNIVNLSESGGMLVMRHSLVGGEGETYQSETNIGPPHRFKVFKGAKQVASGSFEHG
jgi:hypothetical protein